MKRILIADSQEPIRVMVSMALEHMGYEVATAGNGRELLSLAKENPPDLIIMDVMMAEMTGFEALEALRKDPAFAAVPVMELTASEKSFHQEKSAFYGPWDHMVKPVSLPVLRSKVTRVLGGP
jgi:CheY-like chemotaxis protein